MEIIKNTVLKGKHHKPILVDVFYKETNTPKPILVFCHGYKGYKDWGAWNLMAENFANAGFFFVKFNFSHNGGTVEQPIDFPDLDAFGNNNFTKELDDLETVINWACKEQSIKNEANTQQISLLGHSRGGGIVVIKAAEDSRVKNVITLAGASDYKSRFHTGEMLTKWKNDGVMYVVNGRTKQQMPHYYQFYTNFIKNEARLTIKNAVSKLVIPHLIIHGDNDTSVALNNAEDQHNWNKNSILKVVEGANHVFETKHPWEKEELSNNLEKTIGFCVEFLKT